MTLVLFLLVLVAAAVVASLARAETKPRTTLGRWTAWLLLILVALFVWLLAGLRWGGLVRGSPLARTVGLSWCAAAVVTFVLALVSRFKLQDRAAVVVVAIALGGICTTLVALEFVE